jgi:alpha-1,2-mannosyltransferase
MFLILTQFLLMNLLALAFIFIIQKFIQIRLKNLHNKQHGKNTKVLTFMHPNCYDFGGGEKVLWMIIDALTNMKDSNKFYKINILCAPKLNKTTNTNPELSYNQFIINRLKERFSIDLKTNSKYIRSIEMIEFKSTKFLSPFPYFTMILQIFFQILFAFEICFRIHSDTIIDTVGLPFTFSILRFLGNFKLSAYIHYPFISQDMVNDVKRGIEGVHSRGVLAKYKFYRKLKLFYYDLILKFYKINLNCLDFMFTNSTWTYTHLNDISPKVKNEILYPPCSISTYRNNKNYINNINSINAIDEIQYQNQSQRDNVIISFAQFRPEKNQKMQINILREVKNRLPHINIRLCLMGGVRNEDDLKLFEDLKIYAENSGVGKYVEFYPNLSSNEVKNKFETAKIAIHTMRDEHFGISVIEMMSAGLITIAHNSAGPKKDIIGPSKNCVGFLADGN